jgi:biotin transporter BioY
MALLGRIGNAVIWGATAGLLIGFAAIAVLFGVLWCAA